MNGKSYLFVMLITTLALIFTSSIRSAAQERHLFQGRLLKSSEQEMGGNDWKK
jgi:hypothetical protein